MILVTSMAAEHPDPERRRILLRAGRRMFLKRRWRGVAEDGTGFGFDLVSRLRDGCVIHRTEDADYVIRQEPEPVYVVYPRSPEEGAVAAWKTGNLHLPVEILPGEIRILHDPAARQLLEREGWEFREVTLIFNPMRVAAHAA